METLIITVLTSGVLAATITSIINLISIKKTNKRLLDIENIKNKNSIQTFRYSKLFELNSELNTLPDIDYTYLKKKDGKLIQDKNLLAKVVGASTDRFSKLTKIYYKSRPLFDHEIIKMVEDLIAKEKDESNRIVANLYGSGEQNNISNLMNIRLELEENLRISIVKQLEKLIK